MLTVSNLSYIHANGDAVFQQLNLIVNKHQKVALVGNNGSGKSTLLNILSGFINPDEGTVEIKEKLYHVRQHHGQLDDLSVAEVLGVNKKLTALAEIDRGHVTEENLALVGDDWLLEVRCTHAFKVWGISAISLNQKFNTLSGGQKSKALLAGISIHEPQLILLDEPSNHMDSPGREHLYNFVRETDKTLLVVSHDRTLLNLVNQIYELSEGKLKTYGGGYDFYSAQKAEELEVLKNDHDYARRQLKKAREVERETIERKQKQDARGKKKQEKAGLPKILQNSLKNNAQKSTSRLKEVQGAKISSIKQDLRRAKELLPALSEIKLNLLNPNFHKGKKLFDASGINIAHGNRLIWQTPVSLAIYSGDRILVNGSNGSGKTTLMKILLGNLQTVKGTLERASANVIYLDQDYSLVNNQLTILEQTQHYNTAKLPDHELKIRLHRFLFYKESWSKLCTSLSGGEKMRLILCCLLIGQHAPDVIILDEPTNNLDIENVNILAHAIKNYDGTLLLISHDLDFIRAVGIERQITL